MVLFPNPVLDLLTVSPEIFTELNPTGEIQIFSMDGTLMSQKTISLNDHQIDMSALPMGYYAVTIQIGTITEQHLIYKN
ncbi:MAG: hypothetical protein COA50_00220 [Flavobacteriaceae bacterium]|nr:MAG: hypothetical protein COA50_00220 [Flavobacteriaceae bacterium]